MKQTDSVQEQSENNSGMFWQWFYILHALRNSRQENCIILLTSTSGVIKKLHSQTELYQGPITQENPPLTCSNQSNFHFHLCEWRSMHIFRFNVSGTFEVFTSGALCSQTALVRCYFPHSLFSSTLVHYSRHCHSVRDIFRAYVSGVDFSIQVSRFHYTDIMLLPTSSQRPPKWFSD
jgi:hypothetical protein